MAMTLSPNLLNPKLKRRTCKTSTHTQQGFTLLEVMVAMGLLVVALVSMAGVFAYGFANVQSAQYDMLAKSEAREIMESIFAARNSGQLAFEQIDNITTPKGVFLTGFQDATIEGSTNGLFNYSGDVNSTPEALTMPGPDGILGTTDDVSLPFTFMKRQIAITALTGAASKDLKQLQVSVQYRTGSFGQKTYVMTSYISKFR